MHSSFLFCILCTGIIINLVPVLAFDYSGMNEEAKERVKFLVCDLESLKLEIFFDSSFSALYREIHELKAVSVQTNMKLDELKAVSVQTNMKLDILVERLNPVFIFMEWKLAIGCLATSFATHCVPLIFNY